MALTFTAGTDYDITISNVNARWLLEALGYDTRELLDETGWTGELNPVDLGRRLVKLDLARTYQPTEFTRSGRVEKDADGVTVYDGGIDPLRLDDYIVGLQQLALAAIVMEGSDHVIRYY